MRQLIDKHQHPYASTTSVIPGSLYERIQQAVKANKKTTEDIYEKLLNQAKR